MEINAICKICGKTYVKRNGKSKYCSDECKREATRRRQKKWHEEHPDYMKEWHDSHPYYNQEWVKAHPNYARDRSRRMRGSTIVVRECVICGKKYDTALPHKITCSTNCRRKLRNRRGDIRLEGKIVDADITLEKLFARDGGVCYLCGEPCDWSDRTKTITGMNYPSIEHVQPLSRGGLHAWDNVKLAHFGCNIRKSNKLLNGGEDLFTE